ncbi:MAG: GNAT family N-acetyltransferase [Usitatibacteraceae bacterium]
MNIAIESPDQPDVIALIAELDAYQDTLYPSESRHALELSALKQSNVVFVVARDARQRAVGCGAVVLEPAYGELKRMYVAPENRGQGIAKAVLAMLESSAKSARCERIALETGPYQPEALAFDARRGDTRCRSFGNYWDDPLSVFMEKPL